MVAFAAVVLMCLHVMCVRVSVCVMCLHVIYVCVCAVTHVCASFPQLLDKRQYGIDGDPRVDHSRPLPLPFPSRPRIGTRLFVKGNARRILKPLLKELGVSLCVGVCVCARERER